MGELSDSKIFNQEKIENGERFQFIAITDSWKNQRRKRRQQAREQSENQGMDDLDSATEKRCRLDDGHTGNEQSTDPANSATNLEIIEVEPSNEPGCDRVLDILNSTDSPPLLHIEANVESKTVSEIKAIVEIKLIYLNGTSGLNGVYGLLQYIQNKWNQ